MSEEKHPSAHLDEEETARYLNVSVAWLRKQRRLPGGPPVRKFGTLVRYAIADLQDWAASQRQEVL